MSRADAERDPSAAAVVVERDLRRRRDKGEIALAGVDLVEADADARLAPDRKAHCRQAAGRGSAVIIGPMKKSAAAHSATVSPSR